MIEEMEPTKEIIFRAIRNDEYFEWKEEVYQKLSPQKIRDIMKWVNAVSEYNGEYHLKRFRDNEMVKGLGNVNPKDLVLLKELRFGEKFMADNRVYINLEYGDAVEINTGHDRSFNEDELVLPVRGQFVMDDKNEILRKSNPNRGL